MKKLERKQMKNLKGGDAPPPDDDGGSCCCGVNDCADKEGFSKSCSSTCKTNANMGRCRYVKVT